MSNTNVLLITNSYPDAESPERGFIEGEVQSLSASGFRITLLPIHAPTTGVSTLPTGVSLRLDLAHALSPCSALLGSMRLLRTKEFWHELVNRPRNFISLKFWKASIRAAATAGVILRMRDDIAIIYTYWFSGETTGARWSGHPRLISRAHGSDLYLDSPYNGGYIPYRNQDICRLDCLILLSSQARRYVLQHYSINPRNIIVAPLGVSAQNVRSCPLPHRTGRFRLLSCSYASSNAVKRIEFIGKVCLELALLRPELLFFWTHVGAKADELDGIPMPQDLPPNFSISMTGRMPNEFILDLYKRCCVDIFVCLSISEGQPVSIMEAFSFGVPVVATSVGGIPEMMSDGGGLLVSTSDSAASVAREMLALVDDADFFHQSALSARLTHHKRYYDINNRKLIVDALMSLSMQLAVQ